MKHSTKAPTKADRRRFIAIQFIGCVACRQHGIYNTPPDVHHLTEGGRRRGHRYTIGLCPWHHRGVGAGQGVSLAHGSRPFHELYGTDAELLAEQDRLIERYELQQTPSGARR